MNSFNDKLTGFISHYMFFLSDFSRQTLNSDQQTQNELNLPRDEAVHQVGTRDIWKPSYTTYRVMLQGDTHMLLYLYKICSLL